MSIKIHNIGGYMFNNYLLETDAGWIAIDTGYPGGEKTFLKRFKKLASPKELRYIFLTHVHDDHAGFLAELLKEIPAKVIMNTLGAAALEVGRNCESRGLGYTSSTARLYSIFKRNYSFPPVKLNEDVIFVSDEKDQVFKAMGLPIRILFLPGHTADLTGLLLEETGELFCGDAAMNTVINSARHTIWIDDADAYGKTWDKILMLNPSKIYPSHGTPFPPGDLIRYRHYLDSRASVRPRKQT